MPQLRIILTIGLLALPLLALADSDKKEKSDSKRKEPVAEKTKSPDSPKPKNQDSKARSAKSSRKSTKRKNTSDQEAAAIALVKVHHKELYRLLTSLKKSVPHEYNRAIRELSRTSDRLKLFAQRDPKRYDLELQLWQTRSKRQLLTARLQMGADESFLNELRDVLSEEHKLIGNILRHEHDRLVGRVEDLEDQISKQKAMQKETVEKRFNAVKKAVQRSK